MPPLPDQIQQRPGHPLELRRLIDPTREWLFLLLTQELTGGVHAYKDLGDTKRFARRTIWGKAIFITGIQKQVSPLSAMSGKLRQIRPETTSL